MLSILASVLQNINIKTPNYIAIPCTPTSQLTLHDNLQCQVLLKVSLILELPYLIQSYFTIGCWESLCVKVF